MYLNSETSYHEKIDGQYRTTLDPFQDNVLCLNNSLINDQPKKKKKTHTQQQQQQQQQQQLD